MKLPQDLSSLFKTIGLLLIILSAVAIPFSGSGSNSWFTGNTISSAVVCTTSFDEVIDSVSIAELNPEFIEIKKTDRIDFSPVIFFSADGEISDFLLHINPVRLDTDRKYTVKISVDTKPEQIIRLLNSDQNFVTGKINIKYLNEFFDEQHELKFSKQYLIDRFLLKLQDASNNGIRVDSSSRHILSKAIACMAGYADWERPRLAEGIPQDTSRSALGLKMSREQDEIISIVAPGLKEDINSLCNTNNRLIGMLKGMQEEVSQLKAQNRHLEGEIRKTAEVIEVNNNAENNIGKTEGSISEPEDGSENNPNSSSTVDKPEEASEPTSME